MSDLLTEKLISDDFTETGIDWAAGRPERQKILNQIVGSQFKYLFKRKNIKKDLILGFVGERGGGKSGSAAVTTILDFMMDGIPCYSNMKIGMRVPIPDELANKFGIPWGQYGIMKSLPLDMPALLRFDLKYKNSVIFIDEINVEVSEARRSMTNTNLFSNRLGQELRHLESSLIFTAISEMHIDGRLRDLVDCFVKCSDTCNTRDGIERGKPPGIDFKWIVYYMSTCFDGTTYNETKHPSIECFFHFKPWRGIYDDKEFQGEGMMKYGYSLKDLTESSKPKETLIDASKDWTWLNNLIEQYRQAGLSEILCDTVWDSPEALRARAYKNDISEYLKDNLGITVNRPWGNGSRNQYYVL